MNRGEAADWALFIAAIGASIFSWGMGSYHQYRSKRRQEDREDRKLMLEDVRENTRLICELEERQRALKREIDVLEQKLEDTRCRYPDGQGETPCDSN